MNLTNVIDTICFIGFPSIIEKIWLNFEQCCEDDAFICYICNKAHMVHGNDISVHCRQNEVFF